jgi:hypothetical protein
MAEQVERTDALCTVLNTDSGEPQHVGFETSLLEQQAANIRNGTTGNPHVLSLEGHMQPFQQAKNGPGFVFSLEQTQLT